jgi:predicted ATP-dependent protease
MEIELIADEEDIRQFLEQAEDVDSIATVGGSRMSMDTQSESTVAAASALDSSSEGIMEEDDDDYDVDEDDDAIEKPSRPTVRYYRSRETEEVYKFKDVPEGICVSCFFKLHLFL